MPTYEYECDACGHNFEEFQYFSEDPLTKCPGCKKKKLRRLFGTGASIIFKGSGFYETDYKRAGQSSKSGDEGSKTDSKPDAKTDKTDKPAVKPAEKSTEKAAEKPKKKPGAES